jgi:hypothetical protein
MAKIHAGEELRDLNWMAFAIHRPVHCCRCARPYFCFGNVRTSSNLADDQVTYVLGIAFGRFVFMLQRTFGTNLNPHAPVKVDPFMPSGFRRLEEASPTHTTTLQACRRRARCCCSCSPAACGGVTLWYLGAAVASRVQRALGRRSSFRPAR